MAEARHVLTIFGVSDLARATRFYDAAFGWSKAADFDVYVEYEIAGGANLGLYVRDSFASNTGEPPAPAPPAGTTASEIYLQVSDLDSAVERLTAAGARVLEPPADKDWGARVAYFADPENNVVAVAVRR